MKFGTCNWVVAPPSDDNADVFNELSSAGPLESELPIKIMKFRAHEVADEMGALNLVYGVEYPLASAILDMTPFGE